jgi:hypothetical protein
MRFFLFVFCFLSSSFLTAMPSKKISADLLPKVEVSGSFFKIKNERLLKRLIKLHYKVEERRARVRSLFKKDGDCSQILLKNGQIISAEISQITPTEVKYKRCGKPNDPEIILAKKDVISIKASDGEFIYKQEIPNGQSINTFDNRRTTGAGIASFLLGLLALALVIFGVSVAAGLLALLFTIIAGVLGIIGIGDVNKHPDIYKGKGLAIAGLICSLLVLAIFFIAIALV